MQTMTWASYDARVVERLAEGLAPSQPGDDYTQRSITVTAGLDRDHSGGLTSIMNAAEHFIDAALTRRAHGRAPTASSLVRDPGRAAGSTRCPAAAATRSEPPPPTVRTGKLPAHAPFNRVHAGPARPREHHGLAFYPRGGFTRPPVRTPSGPRAHLSLTSVSYPGRGPRHFSDAYVT